jgi:hypothetical protein
MEFNWDSVKGAIGTIAPWIAGTVGTPVAGAAVGLICNALGLDSSKGTPAAIMGALSGATPAQLLALKEADNGHAETMKKLGFDHVDMLASLAVKSDEIDANDRDSARKLAESGKDNTARNLAYGVILAAMASAGAVLGGFASTVMKDATTAAMAGSIVGYLFSEAKQVLAFYFGSSAGSQAKDATIKAMADNP